MYVLHPECYAAWTIAVRRMAPETRDEGLIDLQRRWRTVVVQAIRVVAPIADADEPDIPFYRGLIAFRRGDNAAAVRQFDRFLELAPDDGRASMVSGLRAEAADPELAALVGHGRRRGAGGGGQRLPTEQTGYQEQRNHHQARPQVGQDELG